MICQMHCMAKIIATIHGFNAFNWHRGRKKNRVSLRSSWVSVSKVWVRTNSLAHYKLGNFVEFFLARTMVYQISFEASIPRLFGISLLHMVRFFEYWTSTTLFWNIISRRLLKEEEIKDLWMLLGCLCPVHVGSLDDSRSWSLGTIKSCLSHLILAFGIIFSMYKGVYFALWKSKSLKRVNILMWIMINVSLNCLRGFTTEVPFSLYFAFGLLTLSLG